MYYDLNWLYVRVTDFSISKKAKKMVNQSELDQDDASKKCGCREIFSHKFRRLESHFLDWMERTLAKMYLALRKHRGSTIRTNLHPCPETESTTCNWTRSLQTHYHSCPILNIPNNDDKSNYST